MLTLEDRRPERPISGVDPALPMTRERAEPTRPDEEDIEPASAENPWLFIADGTEATPGRTQEVR
jgi:hypothetical protein